LARRPGATLLTVEVSYLADVKQLLDARKKAPAMFLALAVILFIVWIASFLVFKTAGILIHLLLLFAILSIILHFISGKRAA
jgi:hypothetical protein